MTKKTNNILSKFSRIVFMVLGSILAAIGLEIFLIPNNIIDGGITGISIMASYLTNVKLGVFIFMLNLPFVIIGYRHIGKTFAISTIFSVICFSISVTLLHPVLGVTQDTLLATIFGGIILGVGVGIVIRNGGSLDGTEIVAIIIEKRSAFSIGEIVMTINFFILGTSGFLFGWDRAMYSLIAYFIAFKAIDVTVEGLEESKAVIIVSDKNKDISKAIIDRLGRGITFLDGKGGYSGAETEVIYVVLSRLEIAKLKNIIHDFDKEALITITSVEGTGKKYVKKAIH
ncbi:YitT family protein [Clostridium sp. C2-6-12]|uniref:YitT family protein n=1 Tax=Clostridium sp. C2-6-12 TaxID=2698832 RepID=UPI0013700AB1|nr:YitT family protein [Clostridium sp. C2-6-12]